MRGQGLDYRVSSSRGRVEEGRYVYYRCTGSLGKRPEPFTQQEVLSSEFKAILLLQEFVVPQAILDWLWGAVAESDRTELAARELSRPGCVVPVSRPVN
jgi:hypothetical protein